MKAHESMMGWITQDGHWYFVYIIYFSSFMTQCWVNGFILCPALNLSCCQVIFVFPSPPASCMLLHIWSLVNPVLGNDLSCADVNILFINWFIANEASKTGKEIHITLPFKMYCCFVFIMYFWICSWTWGHSHWLICWLNNKHVAFSIFADFKCDCGLYII